MSDYNSSLPVRTENDGDVVAKISDATTPSQQLAVGSDGSINVTDNGGSLTVDGVDFDIRDLTSASDSVEVLQSVHDDLNANANLQVGDVDVANGNPVPVSDAGGSLTVDAVDLDIRDLAFATDSVDVTGSEVSLDATTLAALESITVNNPAGAGAVNIQDGGNSITVDAADLDIRDLTHVSDSIKVGDGTDFLAVENDGSINVNVTNNVPGDEICDYNTSASVAKDASVNHDYTVNVGKTLTIEEIIISGSGKLKAEILINAVTKIVVFNSTAEPNIMIPLRRMCQAAASQVVRITITNRDNSAQDLYSTLIGTEL